VELAGKAGLLIHNHQQGVDWFIISSAGHEKLDREKLPTAPSASPLTAAKSVPGTPRALLS
jgi:hypothetical protein